MDKCIKDPFDQCFHDCPNCPQCEKQEPDWDFLREMRRTKMFETIKWDGASPIDHEPIIKTALLSYINAEEKERALTTSYGDLGEILKKNHGKNFHGGSYGECIIQSGTKGVTVNITDLNIKYEMTWNKVAKAIHRWVHENAQPPAVTGR